MIEVPLIRWDDNGEGKPLPRVYHAIARSRIVTVQRHGYDLPDVISETWSEQGKEPSDKSLWYYSQRGLIVIYDVLYLKGGTPITRRVATDVHASGILWRKPVMPLPNRVQCLINEVSASIKAGYDLSRVTLTTITSIYAE